MFGRERGPVQQVQVERERRIDDVLQDASGAHTRRQAKRVHQHFRPGVLVVRTVDREQDLLIGQRNEIAFWLRHCAVLRWGKHQGRGVAGGGQRQGNAHCNANEQGRQDDLIKYRFAISSRVVEALDQKTLQVNGQPVFRCPARTFLNFQITKQMPTATQRTREDEASRAACERNKIILQIYFEKPRSVAVLRNEVFRNT